MYKYIDLDKKWNEYGTVKEISNIKEDAHNFSEGLEELENLLITLWNMNLKTKACCRGSHVSIQVDNKPKISDVSYVLFEDNNWKDYLSDKIINDPYIVINTNSVHYYGNDNKLFFEDLNECFKTGLKDNKSLLEDKTNKDIIDLKCNVYKTSLNNLGFLDNQINDLLNLYKKQLLLQREVKKDINNKEKYLEYHETLNKYNDLLINTIKENNKKLSNQA